jgi:hypothetical protein
MQLPFSNQLIPAQDVTRLGHLDGVDAAAFLILKSMTASLVERTAEIGVLKTVGWIGRDVRPQLLAEALILCLLGEALWPWFSWPAVHA